MKKSLYSLVALVFAMSLLTITVCSGKPKQSMEPAMKEKTADQPAALKEGTMEKGKEMVTAMAEKSMEGGGEVLFKAKCAVCHPKGGNIINPKKTLSKADRDVNGIKSAEDIVKTMRNPGPGMTKFPASDISDEDANKIANYILETFK